MPQHFSIEMYHFDLSIKSGLPNFEVAECNGGQYSTVELFSIPNCSSGKGIKLSIDATQPQPSLVIDNDATLPSGNPTFSLSSALWSTIQFWRYKDPFNNVEVFFGTEDLRACSFRVYGSITLSLSELYIAHDTVDPLNRKLRIYVPNNNAVKKLVQ